MLYISRSSCNWCLVTEFFTLTNFLSSTQNSAGRRSWNRDHTLEPPGCVYSTELGRDITTISTSSLSSYRGPSSPNRGCHGGSADMESVMYSADDSRIIGTIRIRIFRWSIIRCRIEINGMETGGRKGLCKKSKYRKI